MNRKLTPEIKQKWLDALRSGEFKQGFGKLKGRNFKDEIVYCCLGVLGCVTDFKSSCVGVLTSGEKERPDDLIYEFLPRETQADLYEMNDNKMLDFNKIANYIETNIPADES